MALNFGDPTSAIWRFSRHVGTLGGGRVVAALLSALWMIVAARSLTTAEFGDLAVLLAVGAIVIIIGDLGYPFLLADAVSRSGHLSASTLAYVIGRRVGVGLLAAVVGVVAYLVVSDADQPLVAILFAVSLISTVVYSSLTAGLRGLGSFSVEAANDVGSRVLVLVVGWLVLAGGGGVVGAVAVYAAVDVLSLVVIALAIRPRLSDSDTVDTSALGFRRAWPLSTGRLLAAFYNRGDTWLMAALRGPVDAALYAAPYRILDGLVLLPRSVGAVAVTHSGERRRAGQSFWPPWTVAAVAAATMAVVVLPLVVFAEPIVTTLFGEDYESAAPVFMVLAASAVPGSVVAVLSPLAGLSKGHAFAALMTGLAATSIVANLVVIPVAGPVGAAWVNLVLQVVLAAVMLWVFGRQRADESTSLIASPPRSGS